MPRKQRFKPSRKPKAVGTLTDFIPLEQVAQVAQVPQVSSPANTLDLSTGVAEGAGDRGNHDTHGYSKTPDLSGESG